MSRPQTPLSPLELPYTEFLEKSERRAHQSPQLALRDLFGDERLAENVVVYVLAHLRRANLACSWFQARSGYQRLDEQELRGYMETGSWPSPLSSLWVRARQWRMIADGLLKAESERGHWMNPAYIRLAQQRLTAFLQLLRIYDGLCTLGDPLVASIQRLAQRERQDDYPKLFPSLAPYLSDRWDKAEAWSCLHHLIQHFLMSMFAPVRTETKGPIHRVIFLECVSFSTHSDNRWMFVEERDAQNQWKPTDYRFDLFRPLTNDFWIGAFVRHWLNRDASLSEQLTPWFSECLRRELGRLQMKSELNRRIRAVLPVQAQLVRAALRLRHYRRRGPVLTNGEYCAAWIRPEMSLRLLREGPRVAPVFISPVLRNEYWEINGDSDIGNLKTLLQSRGVTDFGWKMLCRKGSRLYEPLTLIYPRPGTHAVAAWIQLLQNMNQRKPLPLMLSRMIFDVHVRQWDEDVGQLPPGMIRAAIRHYESLPAKQQRKQFAEGTFARVLWWWRNTRPALDNNQRRAGWSAWLQRCELWELETQAKERAVYWNSALGQYEEDYFRVVPLTTEWALLEDGFVMRHCVPVFLKDCQEGRYRVFSLRRQDNGLRLATVGIELKINPHNYNAPCWEVQQVRGFANGRATDRQTAIAKGVATRYDRSYMESLRKQFSSVSR